MASNPPKRNMFTEKLFDAIEEPWSNESTPSSTPAKQIKNVRRVNAVRLTVDVDAKCGTKNDAMHEMLKSTVESLDDEPEFIVWKLAEKLFLRQLRNVGAAAFAGWVSEINRAMKSQRLSHKSRILHRRKLQLKMFNVWYGTVILISRFVKAKVDVAKFLRSKIKKFVSTYFGHFKRVTLSTHSKSTIIRRCCIRLLRSCIEKWRKISAARARNYTKALKMAYKLCLRASLRLWIRLAKSNRRLETVLRVFQRRMIRKNVNMCFQRWYRCKSESSSMPLKNAWLAHHLDTLQQKRLVAAIKAWSRISAHRRQARSLFLKILCRKMLKGQVTHESWCMHSAIMNWKATTKTKGTAIRPTSAKQTRSVKCPTIGTIFSCWSRCCVVDRRKKGLAVRHSLLKLAIVLKRCFHSWKTLAKAFQTATTKSNHILKYRNLNRKTKTFMIWKHVLADTLTRLVLRADSLRLLNLKRKHLIIWNRWKQRTLRKIALRRAYKSRARLRLSVVFSLRSLFWEWKMGILSEQFFATYIMKRFWGLWRQLLGSPSACISPLEIQKLIETRVKPAAIESTDGVHPYCMAHIYRRKVLRLAMHGWAWTCCEHAALLEKLQIAYMIRSSIRTCTKYFSAWLNETLKISQTSIMCQRPATPITEQPLHEPMDAKQRTFEILNIALVERILLCNVGKRLVRKSFMSWFKCSLASMTIRKKSRLRVSALSFAKWADLASSRIAVRILKRLSAVFAFWKWFACEHSALRAKTAAFKGKTVLQIKMRGMNAWCKLTFGVNKSFRKKNTSDAWAGNQFDWKNMYFAFKAWHQMTKTGECRLKDLEAATVCKFVETTWKKHFNAWMFLCKSSRRAKMIANSKKICSIRQIFQVWSRCTFVKRKADQLVVSLQNYQATSMLVLCWNAWRAGLEQRNYRTLTLSVTRKLIQKCNAVSVPVQIAWNAWRNFISTRRFVRLAKEKIARKVYEKANFRNMFRRWRTVSRRRRNIVNALATTSNTTLRRAFFAFKYNIVRSVFFAMQYKRVSQRFRRKNINSNEQEFSKPHAQNVSQVLPDCDSHPKIITLEERVLELQSEKIKLMEQLKSALQGKQRESLSPTTDVACDQEVHSRLQVTETHDQIKNLRPVQHAYRDVSSCQHPLFPVQSRGQQSGSGKAPTVTNNSQTQHPLFPVLAQMEHQPQASISHQETKVTTTLL